MPRIRIVHLITTLSAGGAERTLQRLLAAMDRESFDSSVISLTGDGVLGSQIRESGIPVESLGMSRGTPGISPLLRLRSILKRERPDILQTWLYHSDLLGLFGAKLATVPRLVWNVRCSEVDMRHYPFLSRVTRRMLAMASRRPDAVIVNSRAGMIAHEAYGYRPRRWVLIPNGFDVSMLQRDEAGSAELRSELGIPPDTPLVGTVGRFDALKDYKTFLLAVSHAKKRHPEIRALMAGAGMDQGNSALARMISEAGIGDGVSLLGERRDIARVLSALDVYCLSSFSEGFPNAVAEAMACEVPAVVTDAGDAAWIVGSNPVPVREPLALGDAIRAMLDLPGGERRAIGVAGRQRIASEFGVQRMVAAYESLYRELAAR